MASSDLSTTRANGGGPAKVFQVGRTKRGTVVLAYDELRGSEGRRVWYRPPRYEAHTIFPGRAPRVCLRSRSYILQNISLGGVAAVSKELAEPVPEVGDVVPLEIQQGGLAIFES